MFAQMIVMYCILTISLDQAVVLQYVDVVKVLMMFVAGFLVGDALYTAFDARQLFL